MGGVFVSSQEVMYEKNVVNYMESFDLGAELSWTEVGEREGIGPNQWPPAAAAPGRCQCHDSFFWARVSSMSALIDTSLGVRCEYTGFREAIMEFYNLLTQPGQVVRKLALSLVLVPFLFSLARLGDLFRDGRGLCRSIELSRSALDFTTTRHFSLTKRHDSLARQCASFTIPK